MIWKKTGRKIRLDFLGGNFLSIFFKRMLVLGMRAKKVGVALFSGLTVLLTLVFLFDLLFVQRLKKEEQKDFVRVMGSHKEKKESKILAEKKEVSQLEADVCVAEEQKNILFENLKANKLGAPIKKEGAGNYYVGARSAVAIDADSQTILHFQDGKKRLAIASLTKIMTAVLVMEKINDLDKEIIIVDQEALAAEGTRVGCPRTGYCTSNRLQLGEQLTARSALEAMLLSSANDAAVAIGKHISGSQEKFAQLMNRRAKELGLQDTNFCNPSGLDIEGKANQCYSSAYDLARIAAHSLQYEEIWKILKIKEKDITSFDGKLVHHLVNTDILLDQMPNCLGGKTGFTYEAGKSLMMAAHLPENQDQKVVAVILDDNYRWQSMKGLFNWVFQAYDWPKNK